MSGAERPLLPAEIKPFKKKIGGYIRVNDGVIYPAGFCGSGTVWARWLGQKAAGMILGKDAETVFSGHRFWTLPFYNGNPWFLPIAMNYYKLRDKLSSKSK